MSYFTYWFIIIASVIAALVTGYLLNHYALRRLQPTRHAVASQSAAAGRRGLPPSCK